MRVRHRGLWPTALLLVLAGRPAPARGGLADTPLPTFSDGRAAELTATLAGVIKNNNVETVVVCTNLASAAFDVGLEVFDETGALRNAVAAGNGAILNVAPGATVTLGTGPVAVLREDQTLTLNAAGSGMSNLRNGSGRIVASGSPLGCAAFAVDALHTIEDPAICPTCQPPSLTTVPVGSATASTSCSPASCDDGNPCTVDGCDAAGACTHTAASGTACNDGNPCTTQDACNRGVCAGTPVVCGPDTPCDQVAACDRNTGQCSPAPPTSLCVPGGGKLATDCEAEWVVDNPGSPGGPNSRIQTCGQGDPRCDFDGDPRQCTFHVRVCLNSHDANLIRLANCQPGQVSTYQLRSPAPRSANASALLDAVGALAPSSRTGKRRNRVSFNPPDAVPDHCTAPVSVVVPAGTLALKVRVTSPAGTHDKDKLRLRCTR